MDTGKYQQRSVGNTGEDNSSTGISLVEESTGKNRSRRRNVVLFKQYVSRGLRGLNYSVSMYAAHARNRL